MCYYYKNDVYQWSIYLPAYHAKLRDTLQYTKSPWKYVMHNTADFWFQTTKLFAHLSPGF